LEKNSLFGGGVVDPLRARFRSHSTLVSGAPGRVCVGGAPTCPEDAPVRLGRQVRGERNQVRVAVFSTRWRLQRRTAVERAASALVLMFQVGAAVLPLIGTATPFAETCHRPSMNFRKPRAP